MALDGESPLLVFARRSHHPSRSRFLHPQIFYLGYSLGQPTTLLWKLIPPRYFVTFLTLCWGSFALRASVSVPSARGGTLRLNSCPSLQSKPVLDGKG